VTQFPISPLDSSASEPTPQPAPATQQVRLQLPVAIPRVTYTILGLTIAVYLLQVLLYNSPVPGLDWLEYYGARINAPIRAGEIWRFITPIFLHASIPHILFNMYALFLFGPGLERHFGHWRFLVLYMLTGFTGNVLSFIMMNDNGYSVGASTAIFGLIAAEGVFLFQNRELFGKQAGRMIGNVVFVVVVNLFLDLLPGIDIWGHIGGLLGGLIFTWFAGPRWRVEGIPPLLHLVDEREMRDVITGTLVAFIIFAGLAVWGILFG